MQTPHQRLCPEGRYHTPTHAQQSGVLPHDGYLSLPSTPQGASNDIGLGYHVRQSTLTRAETYLGMMRQGSKRLIGDGSQVNQQSVNHRQLSHVTSPTPTHLIRHGSISHSNRSSPVRAQAAQQTEEEETVKGARVEVRLRPSFSWKSPESWSHNTVR